MIVIGLCNSFASLNVSPLSNVYWYLVNAGYPFDESVNVNSNDVSDWSIAFAVREEGLVPMRFVLTAE